MNKDEKLILCKVGDKINIEEREKRSISVDLYLNEQINKKG